MSHEPTYEMCDEPVGPHNHYPPTFYKVKNLWLALVGEHGGWIRVDGFECNCGAKRPSQLAHHFEVVARWCDDNGLELPAA